MGFRGSEAAAVAYAHPACSTFVASPQLHAKPSPSALVPLHSLPRQGANPWLGDRCGSRTAVHYAALGGSAACVEAMFKYLPPRYLERNGVRWAQPNDSGEHSTLLGHPSSS